MSIIADLAQRIYTPGSLSSAGGELRFELSNRLDDMRLTPFAGCASMGMISTPPGWSFACPASGTRPRR